LYEKIGSHPVLRAYFYSAKPPHPEFYRPAQKTKMVGSGVIEFILIF